MTILKKDILNIGSLLAKGKAFIEQKKYDLAIEEFEKVVESDPNNEEAHFELGKAYYLQNKYELALKELEEAERVNPSNLHSHFLLAKIHKVMRKYELALEEIKFVLKDPSFNDEAMKEIRDIYPEYIKNIRTFNFQGRYDKVVAEAGKLRDFIPSDDTFFRNKLLNEMEIAQKKLVLDSKMRNLIVTLSTRCNLNCTMCEEIRTNWELPKRTLQEIISYFPYLERVVWQGGEVFLLDYFADLVSKASYFKNLRQVVTTNGLLINENWAEKLIKSNVDLTFSIDGVTKEVYESIRKGARFDILLKNLRNFNRIRKQYAPFLNINLHVVVMKSNYRQIEDFVDFAKAYEFKLLALLPIGGNYDNPENIFYFKDRIALGFLKESISKIEEKAREYDIILENRLPINIKQNKINSERHYSKNEFHTFNNRMLCHLPWIQLYIDYDGSIRPDCVCKREEEIGNVSKDSLAQAWNNQRMQLYRKKIIDNHCNEICNYECTDGRVSERYLKFS